jgi:hypothetical protein
VLLFNFSGENHALFVSPGGERIYGLEEQDPLSKDSFHDRPESQLKRSLTYDHESCSLRANHERRVEDVVAGRRPQNFIVSVGVGMVMRQVRLPMAVSDFNIFSPLVYGCWDYVFRK